MVSEYLIPITEGSAMNELLVHSILLRCCLALILLPLLELVNRLVVLLQDKTYIYDINSLTILDTIDTVPNSKGQESVHSPPVWMVAS